MDFVRDSSERFLQWSGKRKIDFTKLSDMSYQFSFSNSFHVEELHNYKFVVILTNVEIGDKQICFVLDCYNLSWAIHKELEIVEEVFSNIEEVISNITNIAKEKLKESMSAEDIKKLEDEAELAEYERLQKKRKRIRRRKKREEKERLEELKSVEEENK